MKEIILALIVTKLTSQVGGNLRWWHACHSKVCFSGGSTASKATQVLHQLQENSPKPGETCTFYYFDPLMLNSLGIRVPCFSLIYTQNNSQIL